MNICVSDGSIGSPVLFSLLQSPESGKERILNIIAALSAKTFQ
jgi:hypothetical protein